MTDLSQSDQGIWYWIDQGATVVTPGDFLARDIQVRYSLRRRDSNQEVWVRPTIQSLRRFVIGLWESGWPTRQLLSPVQEILLYKSAVDKSPAGDLLISSMSTARAARRAAALVSQYRISVPKEEAYETVEVNAFRGWLATVRDQLQQQQWTTQDILVDELIEMIRSGSVRLPRVLVFTGFVHETPQYRLLLGAIRGAGSEVIQTVVAKSAQIRFLRPADTSVELRHVLSEIREMLVDANRDGHMPRIAIAVANLEQARKELEPLLYDYLAPDCHQGDQVLIQVPWRFSRGLSLNQHRLCQTALDILSLRQFDNPVDNLSRVLLNPEIYNAEERAAAFALDYRLRELSVFRVGLSGLVRISRSAGDHPIDSSCLDRFSRLSSYLELLPAKALPSSWSVIFQAWLDLMGWKESHCVRPDYLVNAMDEAFSHLTSMDSLLGQVTLDRAYAWFREVCSTREVRTPARHAQPVDICSYDDIPGTDFDVVFILGASVDSLPIKMDSCAFLPPADLQRVGVPFSSPEHLAEYSRKIANAMSVAATTVYWSCPLVDSTAP